ncbi:hypothetical protein A5821_001658 [Enterococcus sp. 7F3_DIV0205]|uniref:Lipoprotein n=1 Tax=Candidatus Enterococcus palustris TaxID=1834189 RepID=A0AAQ3Y527_9ENTE|nr:DUF1307 domain-containing protein [Enterococcus sp. 7F3_DIV0205]OTN86053.1 hypothetical protein A5821_002003 [Enterococcus sp. 7F3_DIV0205]
MKNRKSFSRFFLLAALSTTVTLVACTPNENNTNNAKTSESKQQFNLESSSKPREDSSNESPKSGGKTGSATYTQTLGGKENKLEKKVTYENGKITSEDTVETIPYAGFNIKNKQEAEELLSEKQKELEGVEGVSYSIEYHEDRAIESYKIDFTKADPEKIAFLSFFAETPNIDEAEKLLFEMGYKKN